MPIDEHRSGKERRNREDGHSQPPFLTQEGLIYLDRRQHPDRRQAELEAALARGDVEEIELKPVPCA